MHGLLEVELALIHENLKSVELVLAEVHCWGRHVLIHCMRKQTHIPHGVGTDAIHESRILRRAIMIITLNAFLPELVREVIELNVEHIGILVRNALLVEISEYHAYHKNKVLALAMNRVLWESGVNEIGQELDTLHYN